MTNKVVFITGRNPELRHGGHDFFVRAHALAGIGAGFEPHLFFVGAKTRVVESGFGVLHETASPYGFPHSKTLPFNHRLLAPEVERFLVSEPDTNLIHSFGIWGYIGVAVRRRLWRRHGRQITLLVSAYSTLKHETGLKVKGIRSVGNRRERCQQWIEYLWAGSVLARCERQQFRNARRVLVNYKSVSRIITDQFGPGISFRHMPYCAETAFREDELMRRDGEALESIRKLHPPEAPLIVTVSRQDPRKGLDVLLHALARLRAKDVSFRACLVGRGLLLENHRKLAEQLGLMDVTTFTGWVEEPFDYLRHADVFVLPSLEEGSGSVALLEAFQAGVAVVASDIDGMPEDVTDGESGLLVKPGDVSALAGTLERLLVDADLRRRLAQRGRLVFEERFSAAAFTEALRDLYAELGFNGQGRGG